MTRKRATLTSLQDLTATRLGNKDAQRKAAPAPRPVRDTVPPPLEDESALFLTAVAGNVDVSQKNPQVPPKVVQEAADTKDAALFHIALGVPEPPAPPQPPAAPDPALAMEDALFSRAMDGVAPISARGRDLHPPRKSVEEAPVAAFSMHDLFTDKVEFFLEYTDEFIQGHVLGFDPLILARLRAGAYSSEGHVDLHGKNLEQAYTCLAAFIKSAYLAGKRHLIVITGRGKNSPGGTPVLRERVQAWFTRDPFKRAVLAFCSAKPGDGGTGALYVLLRKRKKGQGKIIWDRTPSEEELFY